MKLRIPYGLREMAVACAEYFRQTLGQYVAAAVLSPIDVPENTPILNFPEKLTREDSVSIAIPDNLLPVAGGEEESVTGRIRECLIARVRRDWPTVKAHNNSDEQQYQGLKTMLELYPRPFCRAFFEERLKRYPHLEKFRRRFEPMLIDYTPAHVDALILNTAKESKVKDNLQMEGLA